MGRWFRFKGGGWWDVGLGLGEGFLGLGEGLVGRWFRLRGGAGT